MNAHFPLLHRPTFDRQWRDQLYERDVWFTCLCMSIFGLASRWSNDPRVLSDEHDPRVTPPPEDPIWNTAGWKYIQVAFGASESTTIERHESPHESASF